MVDLVLKELKEEDSQDIINITTSDDMWDKLKVDGVNKEDFIIDFPSYRIFGVLLNNKLIGYWCFNITKNIPLIHVVIDKPYRKYRYKFLDIMEDLCIKLGYNTYKAIIPTHFRETIIYAIKGGFTKQYYQRSEFKYNSQYYQECVMTKEIK